MRKIFLDTNFLMDYLVRPEYSQTAANILKEGSKKGYRFVITSFEIADNTYSHLYDALCLKANDYEDAIQYQTALSNSCMAIITRNAKDFAFSNIPLFTPDEFLVFLTT